MPGRLADLMKVDTTYYSAERTTANTLYEGGGTTGNGFDTRDYDECTVEMNVGSVDSGATLTVTIVEADSDSTDGSNAVTGAAFDSITNTNEKTNRRMFLRCADTKRYLWAKVVKTGTARAEYGISFCGYKDNANPNSDDFDAEVTPVA